MINFYDTYLRKDSASASNVYYGYTNNLNASDTDPVWSIRRVSTSAGVESTKWSNNNVGDFISTWSERVNCFTAPTGSIAFTFSSATASDGYVLSLSWTDLSGVDVYRISLRDVNNQLLDTGGRPFVGPYRFDRIYTDSVVSAAAYNSLKVYSGTYSVTVTAINAAGSTSSTITRYFS